MSNSANGYNNVSSINNSDDLYNAMFSMEYLQSRYFAWHKFRPKLDRFLYRYAAFDANSPQSIERIEDIIFRSQLWLSSPKDFNDPFDCEVKITTGINNNINTIRNRLDLLFRNQRPELGGVKRQKAIAQLMNDKANVWGSFTEEIARKNRNSLGITCFSINPRNLLMWSHYANNHTGICFEFEVLRDFLRLSKALTVNYGTTFPVYDFFTSSDTEIIQSVLHKYQDWSYEDEKRIIIPDGSNKWYKFEPRALTKILIGSRTSDKQISKLLEIIELRNKAGLPTIRLLKAKQHLDSYKISFYSLN